MNPAHFFVKPTHNPASDGIFQAAFWPREKESLDQGLAKSKQSVMERISRVFTGRRRIDEDLMDDLEEALILSDVGVDTTEAVLERSAQACHMGSLCGSAGIDDHVA